MVACLEKTSETNIGKKYSIKKGTYSHLEVSF